MTIPDVCPSCNTSSRITAAGICVRCRDELRFIVRPEAHRELYRRRVATGRAVPADLDLLELVVVANLPQDNALWICDICNAQIPVTGEYTLIPVAGSYALCTPCAATAAFWPTGWTQPTPLACRCSACHVPLLAALTRT